MRNASTGAQTGIRTERYYYDGARRIQEVVAAPIELIEPFTGGGGSGGDPLDGGTNIGDEMLAQGGEPTQPGGGGGVGGIEIHDVWLDREYVYVPSNAGGYVDEFIAQIDRFNDVWYVLQDANFNVLGLTDSGGELVEQRTYDPYGEILTRESFTAHPGFKAGHQGLFFDRLDPPAAVGGSVSMGAASQLEPNTFGLYQVRNRVLLPRYGRWAQKDPNASGMLHASLWHDGQSPSPDLAAGSLDAMLGDGANLFAFVGNSPFNATDPSGLVVGMISVFQGITGIADVRAREAKVHGYAATKTAAHVLKLAKKGLDAADTFGHLMGVMPGAQGSLIEELFAEMGLMSMSEKGKLTKQMIAENVAPWVGEKYGDPLEWQFVKKKPGSGDDGDEPGDTHHYEIYKDAFKQLIEVHYFRDAGYSIKLYTIKIKPYSP